MIGRAVALGLATLLFAAPVALADETPDSMGNVTIPADAEKEEEEEEAEPIEWARKGVYLQLDGELIVEDFRATTNRGKPKSEVTGGISVRAGWRAARPLALEIQYERVFDLLGNWDANVITANLKYIMLVERRYQPFISTGFGAIFGKLPNSWTRKGPPGSVNNENSFIWKIGAGIDYGIREHLTATLYADYAIPTEEFHKLNYAAIGLGLRYTF